MKKLLSVIALSASMTTTAFASTIEGTGASFPYPVYKAWISSYYNATGNKVNYSPTGSGTGIKEISARHVNFGGSDKPLKPSELKKAGLDMFPTVVGAITFSYNLPGVDNLKLSEKSISGIVLGDIKYWDDASLKADNPNANLPHEKILFVHRSDKSGTTFNFTYYLSKMNKTWNKNFGAKKAVNWPMENHIAGKGNFGVATAIETNKFSIGYVDYADAKKNGLKMASVQGHGGKYFDPTPANFVSAAGHADLDPKKDFYSIIAYPDNAYPMVAATFILLPEGSKMNKQTAEFFDYAYKNGDKAASDLGYVPLPSSVKDKIRAYWTAKGIL
ncbi:phosphate ABC transporter substrate-binding protein PstS [Thiomicrorhabdus sp. ZW0627]|uniref:phosphate ABC transporter substrate-binding protein PstS n=1 Tax=Thiomicrorhabdus sp. ZW0627 TaxID=3039774 RepID=UPI0024362E8D|nr:phosphate ABC transporter substrate-binding protein PstS [Thiomicrorhabdus sp. ZW0627]MDG6774818.1 phosphate ABC transporter substrate-binding protein PstS [Thiomicrorhabdus sp. ZW0627]